MKEVDYQKFLENLLESKHNIMVLQTFQLIMSILKLKNGVIIKMH